MAFFEAKDGTSIFYTDAGAGVPIVLVHGWPLSSESWRPQTPALLDAGYRVIAYDRRGFGRSGKPAFGYDYDTLASDLDSLITTLGLDGAILVGFSMGGGEVARYLSTYGSSRVARAALVSSVTPYLLKSEANPEGLDGKVFQGMVNGIRKDRKGFMETFSHQFYGRTILHHTVTQQQLDQFVGEAMQASEEATVACVHAFSTTDFRDDLLKITVPTLIVAGSSDATIPIDASACRAVTMIRDAQLIEYKGEAHGLTLTSRDRFNTDLIEFLHHPAKVAAA